MTAILEGMSIGGTLAEARQAAGLTVSDVSAGIRADAPATPVTP